MGEGIGIIIGTRTLRFFATGFWVWRRIVGELALLVFGSFGFAVFSLKRCGMSAAPPRFISLFGGQVDIIGASFYFLRNERKSLSEKKRVLENLLVFFFK